MFTKVNCLFLFAFVLFLSCRVTGSLSAQPFPWDIVVDGNDDGEVFVDENAPPEPEEPGPFDRPDVGDPEIFDDSIFPSFESTCGFGESLRGTLTTNFGGADDQPVGVATLLNGKIVVASSHNEDFALTLYHPDGRIDTSFGVNGRVSTDFDGQRDTANDVVVQPDGRILVAGSARRDRSWDINDADIALARYLPSGSLDGTFGEDGRVMIDIDGSNDRGYAVAIQEDGRIVVVGEEGKPRPWHVVNTDFVIARLHPDGRLDTSFHENGLRGDNAASGANQVEALPDGRILAGGFGVFFRLNPDGSFDQSFDENGKMDYRTDGVLVELVANDDGSFFTLTTTMLASYGPSGSLIYSRALGFEGAALARQADGKLVVAGTATNVARGDFALARYLPNGALDLSFGGGDGYVTAGTVPGRRTVDAVVDMVVQPDEKILVAGFVEIDGVEDYALARFLPTGGLDRCDPDPIAAGPNVILDLADTLVMDTMFDDRTSPPESLFLRGDANGDGMVNIADPSFISNFVFGIGLATTPPCAAAADTNDDDSLNIADISYLANFIFGIAPATPPPAPFPQCGLTRAEVLGCESSVCDVN